MANKRKTKNKYIEYDFELASLIGTSATLVLGALINHYYYFEKTKMLKDGKFFNTKEDIGTKTNLKPCAILKAENLLEKIGYITVSKRAGKAGRLNDYTVHFDVINRPLESIKPLLKIDLTTPKDVIMQSKGRGNQHKESTLMNYQKDVAIENQHKKLTVISNTRNTSSIPGRFKPDEKTVDFYFGPE